MDSPTNAAISKTFEYGTIIIKNGLLQFHYNEMEKLDLAIAKVCVEDRVKFSNGTSFPCLFDVTKVKNSTSEARDYMAKEGAELVTASALLVNSPVLRMAGNFFIAVNKPIVPNKLFTNINHALEWLSGFKGD